ncbi:hypothetical protein F5Y14DRAFT_459604 [Nemania sp. NC0429]|nr:hypothetical protein F5Y14DRAFT_459604 [Nemania sp. NC0429]
MDAAGFRKYVEGMNQQPLDKNAGRESTRKLLPHQRRGATNNHVTTEESETQAITKSCEKDSLHDTLQKGVSTAPTSALMKSGVLASKEPSSEYNGWVDTRQNEVSSVNHHQKLPKSQPANSYPHQRQSYSPAQEIRRQVLPQEAHTAMAPGGIKNGLAQSRWAGPIYNVKPVGEAYRPLSMTSTPTRNEQRDTVGKQTKTHFGLTTDTPANRRPIEKTTSPSGGVAGTPVFKYNPLAKVCNHDTTPNSSNQSYTHDTALDALENAENKTCASGFQSLVAVASVASPKDDPEVTAKGAESLPQDGGLGICERRSNHAVFDPRGNWPTESGSQGWTPRHETKSSDALSSSPGDKVAPRHITEFIRSWVHGAHLVNTTFLTENTDRHEDCDVDTYEGRLMAPIQYPPTRIKELLSRHQCEDTSAVAMKRFAAEIARRARKPKDGKRTSSIAAEAMADREPEPLLEEPNPNEIQIPCHLRPAEESDIDAITEIYNYEIENGYKVMDTDPVGRDDFHSIYRQCLVEKMPFVVAVEGSYEVVQKRPQSVIGFSLITALCRGIVGSHETLSRPGGKLLVIVKPEHRRKKIGTALIDIITTNCTGRYLSKGGYRFVNFTHDWMSTEFGRNPRKWWYLEMEVMIRSSETEEKTRRGEEFQWIWNFLEARFNFILKHYDEKCFYKPSPMIWLDKLTFRRICRTLGE